MSASNENLVQSVESANEQQVAEQRATISNPYDNNLEFQLVRSKILTKLLTEEDKRLIANLIDQSKKVILHMNDLKQLIAAMKSTVAENVNISACETIMTTCCKARVLPFKSITSINITGKDFTSEDRAILEDIYHISLRTVYDEPFVKL